MPTANENERHYNANHHTPAQAAMVQSEYGKREGETRNSDSDPLAFIGTSEKLTIGSLDDPHLTVVAQYNPRELSIKKQHSWTDKPSSDGQIESKELEYKGQSPAAMSVEMLFDGYESDGTVNGRKIMDLIADIEKMAAPREPGSKKDETRRPHHCVVAWGASVNGSMPKFPCVIEAIDTKFQMFARDGRVLRATVTVQLKQLDQAGPRGAIAAAKSLLRKARGR